MATPPLMSVQSLCAQRAHVSTNIGTLPMYVDDVIASVEDTKYAIRVAATISKIFKERFS